MGGTCGRAKVGGKGDKGGGGVGGGGRGGTGGGSVGAGGRNGGFSGVRKKVAPGFGGGVVRSGSVDVSESVVAV